jgi:hypothetical protein
MPTFDDVKAIAQTLPRAEESTSYRTPAIKVCGKLVARLREDGESLAILASLEARTALPSLEPQTFSIPQHYVGSEMFVIALPEVQLEELRELLTDAWRIAAHKSRSGRAALEVYDRRESSSFEK